MKWIAAVFMVLATSALADSAAPFALPAETTSAMSIAISSMVTIHPDGSIEYGENYKPDEAAKAFWDAVGVERKARNCK